MFRHRRRDPGDAASAAGLGVGRRTLTLLLLVGLLGVPAAVLRAFCAGHSCDEPASASSEVPFCSLPDALRKRVAAGFREGRSPDVLGVTGPDSLFSSDESLPITWPSVESTAGVPIAFWGYGVSADGKIPTGTGLDSIAPTIALLLDFDRPHPEVRSGVGVALSSGDRPRLVVEVVWVGRGSDELRDELDDHPFLAGLIDRSVATFEGDALSLPLDPTAILTTIGTGGTPSQHGITGTLLRDDEGRLRRAWTPSSPVSIIATLGDDLDEELGQKPVVGMAAGRRSYLGAIGGEWYIDVDEDVFVKAAAGREAVAAARLLGDDFGADRVPDLAVIAVEGGPDELEQTLRVATRRADAIAGGKAAFLLTATGSRRAGTSATSAAGIARDLTARFGAEVVEADVPGGLFLDQSTLADEQIPEDAVLRAVADTQAPVGGTRLFADVFPAIAVVFERYC